MCSKLSFLKEVATQSYHCKELCVDIKITAFPKKHSYNRL